MTKTTTMTMTTMTTTTTKLRTLVGLAATALMFGCTAGTKASTPGTGGAGAAGASGSSGGGTTGTGGSSVDASFDFASSDHPGADGVCSSNSVPAEPVPLDLYMVMDTSKSMNDPTDMGPSKWDAVKTAMNAFFTDGASAGLGIGLKYFPQETSAPATCAADSDCGSYGPCDYRLACIASNVSSTVDTSSTLCPTATTACPNDSAGHAQTCQRIQDCSSIGELPCVAQGTGKCDTGCVNFTGYCHNRDVCTSASYATPDVAIMTLPAAATALNASLSAHSPGGYTPTGPALQGAVDFAHQRLSTVTDHRIAVVLVTDGLPGGFIPGFPPAGCTPADIPGIATILSGASRPAAGTPPVLTFVIGVFPSDPTAKAQAQTNLDVLAAAGQPTASNGKAVIIDTSQNVSQALQTALKQVQAKAIPCDFMIPSSGVSFDKVNVTFTTGGNDVSVGHAQSDGTMGAGCDSRGGWYYDKDPASGAPSKITACPATCQMFQSDLNGKVNIVLGCPTIDVG